MQLKVLEFDKNTNSMKKTFGSSGHRVKNLESLAQHFIIILFQTPGSDGYSPHLGGGLNKIVMGNYHRDEVIRLYRNVSVAVMRTKEQILESQVNLSLPDAEKLKSATIVKNEISSSGKLTLWIRLESQSGESIDFPIGG